MCLELVDHCVEFWDTHMHVIFLSALVHNIRPVMKSVCDSVGASASYCHSSILSTALRLRFCHVCWGPPAAVRAFALFAGCCVRSAPP